MDADEEPKRKRKKRESVGAAGADCGGGGGDATDFTSGDVGIDGDADSLVGVEVMDNEP